MEGYNKLFKELKVVEPPKELYSRVLTRVNAEEARIHKNRVIIWGTSMVASLGASLWAVMYLLQSATTSGFREYVSLLLSEQGAAITYWKELSLSLTESLPILGLIIFFSSVGLLIWSFANTFRGIRHLNISFN